MSKDEAPVMGIPLQPQPAYAHQPMPPPYLYSVPLGVDAQTFYYGTPPSFQPPPYAPPCPPPSNPQPEVTADFSGSEWKRTDQPYAADSTRVTHLNYYHNRVQQLVNLHVFPNLLRLTVKWNDLKSFEGLQEAPNLRWLDASGNHLRNLQGMGKLDLEWLDLHYNDIGSFSGLAICRNLTYVNLNANKLTSLSGIENLPNLRFLDVSFNDIADTKGLQQCGQLQEVNFSSNRLASSSLSSLMALAELPHFFRIAIYNNDLDSAEENRVKSHFQQTKSHSVVLTTKAEVQQAGWPFDVSADIGAAEAESGSSCCVLM